MYVMIGTTFDFIIWNKVPSTYFGKAKAIVTFACYFFIPNNKHGQKVSPHKIWAFFYLLELVCIVCKARLQLQSTWQIKQYRSIRTEIKVLMTQFESCYSQTRTYSKYRFHMNLPCHIFLSSGKNYSGLIWTENDLALEERRKLDGGIQWKGKSWKALNLIKC